MNKLKRVMSIFAVSLALTLCACGGDSAVSAAGIDETTNVLHSDLTAIDYLEGMWTNNRGQYIAASRGDGMLILWNTNITMPQCEVYVLRDGVLIGGASGGEETQLLSFAIVDDDTLTVHDVTNEEESTFIRDSLEADVSCLDNDYVFWNLNHAGTYLAGMWMNDDGNYFTLSFDDNGAVAFNSDMPSIDCDYIDFYDSVMCGFTKNADGTLSREELFRFDIVSEDEVGVYCALDDSNTVFHRLSRELDAELLNSKYIFANNQRAFTYLNGRWKDDEWHYFLVQITDGGLSWNTNLPLNDKCVSYGFSGGALVGTEMDDNGEERKIEIYSFRVISENELVITVSDSGESYTLMREGE